MPAPLTLIRKFHALMNRVIEALNARNSDRDLTWHFDPLDAVPWFERWAKVRAELIATEPELDDIPVCIVPTPTVPDNPNAWGWFDGRGYIHRDPVMRMFKDMKTVRCSVPQKSRHFRARESGSACT